MTFLRYSTLTSSSLLEESGPEEPAVCVDVGDGGELAPELLAGLQ